MFKKYSIKKIKQRSNITKKKSLKGGDSSEEIKTVRFFINEWDGEGEWYDEAEKYLSSDIGREKTNISEEKNISKRKITNIRIQILYIF